MSVKNIKSLISKVKPKYIILLCHQNADPDALCSAFAFLRLLKRLEPNVNVDIACPEGMSKLSKALTTCLPIKVLTSEPRFGDADIIAMLDTNTVKQLGEWGDKVKKARSPVVVIDHHASHPETEKIGALCISDEGSSSTCEIVYGFFKESALSPRRKKQRRFSSE